MDEESTRTSKLFAAGVVCAWTALAWALVMFVAGWAGSLSDVLLDPHNEHLWGSIVIWAIALSPAGGWWLLLTGRLDEF
jgi:hypothetical protein